MLLAYLFAFTQLASASCCPPNPMPTKTCPAGEREEIKNRSYYKLCMIDGHELEVTCVASSVTCVKTRNANDLIARLLNELDEARKSDASDDYPNCDYYDTFYS